MVSVAAVIEEVAIRRDGGMIESERILLGEALRLAAATAVAAASPVMSADTLKTSCPERRRRCQ
jgi:hypothetical protein